MRTVARPILNNWRVRPREQRTILFIGDLFVSILALFAGLYFWGQKYDWLKFSLDFLKQRVELWFYFLPVIWMIFLVELYDVHRAKNLRQTVGWIALAALAGLLLYALIYLISPQGSLPRLGIGFFLAFAAVLTFNLAAGLHSNIHCPGISASGIGCRSRKSWGNHCSGV